MKKIIFVAMIIYYAHPTTFAQSKIPNPVTTAFNLKFPKALKIKWGKENAHEYEANFEWNDKKISANFSDAGEWLETESLVTFNELPKNVQASFNKGHPGLSIKAVAKIENSKGAIKYEIEFKRGLKVLEVFYTTDGTEIKQ